MLSRIKNRKGFTLIELIVVIAIIAILAVVLIPRFAGFTDDAHEKAVMSDARNILMTMQAIEAKGVDPSDPDVEVGWTDITDFTMIDAYAGSDYAGKTGVTFVNTGAGGFTYEVQFGDHSWRANCEDYVITGIDKDPT